MYLHIGNGETVRESEVIGIFDLDTASVSALTRDFLMKRQTGGALSYADEDLPRSFLVLAREKKQRVTLSRISPAGLKARMEAPFEGTEE